MNQDVLVYSVWWRRWPGIRKPSHLISRILQSICTATTWRTAAWLSQNFPYFPFCSSEGMAKDSLFTRTLNAKKVFQVLQAGTEHLSSPHFIPCFPMVWPIPFSTECIDRYWDLSSAVDRAASYTRTAFASQSRQHLLFFRYPQFKWCKFLSVYFFSYLHIQLP